MSPIDFRQYRIVLLILVLVFFSTAYAYAVPPLDKTRYHTWEEVESYFNDISKSRKLKKIVRLIPIGYTKEGKCLKVLQISKKGFWDEHPDRKPAAFIMGAHHGNEHVSKEAVLALIDKIITEIDTEVEDRTRVREAMFRKKEVGNK